MKTQRTPRLASTLLAYLLPAEAREAILGDLTEEFRARPASLGARLWYWREVLSLIAWYRWERLRQAQPSSLASLIDGCKADLRAGWRMLRSSPGLSIIAVVTLALGIGANTALFSVVNAVLLRPLPYPAPERLVTIYDEQPERGIARQSPSPGNFLDWQARNKSFAAMAAWWQSSRTFNASGSAVQIETLQVNGDFFALGGVPPALGRVFNPQQYSGAYLNEANKYVGGDRVVVLSDGFWRRVFGADPDVIGRKVTIDSESWEVIGVMPAGFALPNEGVDLWTPWDFVKSYPPNRFPGGPPRDYRFLRVAGRLRDGVTIEQAQSDLAGISADLATRYPDVNRGWTVRLSPLASEMVRDVRPALLVLLAAVGGVLLIACANVAGLLLAKAASRKHEMAVRAALGASRWRLIRQLLTESLLLAAAGGIAGVVLANWGTALLIALAPGEIPRLNQAALDGRVLIFTAAIALATGLIFGLVPALAVSKVDLTTAIKESARKGSSGGALRPRWRRAFVAAQIAMALVLLIGAGLIGRSFARVLSVDPGFEARKLLVMRVFLNTQSYNGSRKVSEYYGLLFERLRGLPGVESVAATTVLPMSNVGIDFVRPYWRAEESDPGGLAPKAGIRMATPDYFTTMGIPIREGRAFTAADQMQAPRVLMVNEEMARRVWPGESPIGRQLVIDYRGGKYPYQVVGVAGNTRYYGFKRQPEPEIFIPHAQNTYLAMNVIARTTGDPATLSKAAEQAALEVDPSQPIHSIVTMEDLMSRWVAPDRFALQLFSAFAGLAALLAAIGVYGVMAHLISLRTREIGIRMALGAEQRDVLRLVLGEAGRFVGAGIAIGLLAAFALVRFVAGLLYQVSEYDPATFTGVTLLLGVIAIAASLVPAGRATNIEPMTALREE
jgi:putative ABC transport system permease protein